MNTESETTFIILPVSSPQKNETTIVIKYITSIKGKNTGCKTISKIKKSSPKKMNSRKYISVIIRNLIKNKKLFFFINFLY